MARAFDTLNRVMLSKEPEKEDECDLYGKLLANKLRKYPENERQEIMYEIDGMLVRRNRTQQYMSPPPGFMWKHMPSSRYAPYSQNRSLSSTLIHDEQDQIPTVHRHDINPPSGASSYTQESIHIISDIGLQQNVMNEAFATTDLEYEE